jgi:RNA polymerase sigma-70 factor (ECF subfamily)
LNRETDEIIYSRYVAERNEDDLRTLLERHRDSLTLFIYGIVRNMEDAEDIMISAFATAATGEAGFSGRSSFRTWLFGIARNLARKHLRKSRPLSGVSETLDDSGAEEAEDELIRSESRRELYDAMRDLPEDYRNALYLAYFEDMSHEDIARIMHKTKKQVYNLIFRGKQSLRGLLEDTDTLDEEH